MKKLFVIIVVLFLFPFSVDALHDVVDSRCTVELKTKLRDEGHSIVYRLSKVKLDTDVSYTAYFYNITSNINLIDSNNNVYDDGKIEKLKPGTKIIVNMYASNNTYCEGYKISSLIISVPFHNPYYGSDMCKGNEAFSLCSEDANVTLSEEEFKIEIKKINQSKLENEEEDVDVIENSDNSLFDYIIMYKNYILLLIAIIVIGLLIILGINKKKRGGIL